MPHPGPGLAALLTIVLPFFASPCTATAERAACQVQELMFNQASAPGATAPAFSPDGRLVVFGKTVGDHTFLFESEKTTGGWGVPHLARFSGTFTDIEPAFAPNGQYLIFSSNRPLSAGASLTDGNYDGKVRPAHGGHLWQVSRTSSGWGEPIALSGSVNAIDSTFSPSIAGDNTLYFMRPAMAGGKFHLYSAHYLDGHYLAPELVSFSNLEGYGDFDPAVSKDGHFLIFSSSRPPSVPHRSDLFLVYRTQQGWSEPADLRSLICEDVFGVEARLSPDEKTLYFTNSRRLASDPPESPDHPYMQHTWQVDLPPIKQPKETLNQ